MHRALYISEIVSAILVHVHVQVYQDRHQARRSLLALGLSCTALKPLAMDFLWTNVDDLRPLLRLIPFIKEDPSFMVCLASSFCWACHS